MKTNVTIAYHCIIQYYAYVKICSCLNTTSAPLICCNVILVNKDFNFVCLHTIYITITVTTNDIITVTNRKHLLYSYLKRKLCLNPNHYYHNALFTNQKFLFYAETGAQSPSTFLVPLINQN